MQSMSSIPMLLTQTDRVLAHLVYHPDHVRSGGAPAALGEGQLCACACEPGGAPGRDDLRPRGLALPRLLRPAGPVQEGGQGA